MKISVIFIIAIQLFSIVNSAIVPMNYYRLFIYGKGNIPETIKSLDNTKSDNLAKRVIETRPIVPIVQHTRMSPDTADYSSSSSVDAAASSDLSSTNSSVTSTQISGTICLSIPFQLLTFLLLLLISFV